MFNAASRYAKLSTIQMTDARGRVVEVVPPAPAPVQTLKGLHVRREGERPDHLAALYLGDATLFWRLAEQANFMTAEVLSEQKQIGHK
jgi:hypothetical protein